MGKVKIYYFSPTGSTRQAAQHLGDRLGELLGAGVEQHSYTLPREREALPQVEAGDVVVWATPVYAGRIPNKTLDYVRRALHADGNRAVALVTFGNRAYDNALAELVGLMEEGGMKPVGAAALVTRHAFSDTLGAGRPNEDDLAALDRFAAEVSERLSADNAHLSPLAVPGEAHPERYYTPLKTNNAPAGFLKAKPSCNSELCTRCGECRAVCPMGSIGVNDGMPTFDGICIKCQACRRHCPSGAIAFTDPEYLSHVAMIERSFATPKRAEFYVAFDTTNMCSHLRRKLFEEEGEYHRLWLALQDDPELTAVVRSRQLHIYRKGKKILVLAGKAAPKVLRDDKLCDLLPQK